MHFTHSFNSIQFPSFKRVYPNNMAEVHIIGTIIGASDFDEPTLCCKYTILSGDSWSLIEGTSSGQTHVDTPMDPSFTLWSHPIDVHYNTKSISGWPKLIINVYHQDCYGRNILCIFYILIRWLWIYSYSFKSGCS